MSKHLATLLGAALLVAVPLPLETSEGAAHEGTDTLLGHACAHAHPPVALDAECTREDPLQPVDVDRRDGRIRFACPTRGARYDVREPSGDDMLFRCRLCGKYIDLSPRAD